MDATPDVTSTAAPQPTVGAPELDAGQDAWAVAWRQLRRNRLAVAAFGMLFVLFGVASFAPLLANGRPLYLRAPATNVYENDIAAFSDWDRRLRESTLLLSTELPEDERAKLLERRALYLAGLPSILDRLRLALAPAQQAAFDGPRDRYRALLQAGPDALDAAALGEAGAAIERDFGALSLGAAYKRAAAPLLTAGDWVEAVGDARAQSDAAALLRLVNEGAEKAVALKDAAAAVLIFVPPEDRARPSEVVARALLALTTAHEPGWSSTDARVALLALEATLDDLAARRVPASRQLLPQVEQWPAFRYLTPLEVGFMVLYLGCVAALALRKAFARLHGQARAAALLGPAGLAVVLWAALVPSGLPPADTLYKELARSIAQEPEAGGVAVFPLVPFGENENIYVDRVTPPALHERWSADGGEGLARRMREPGEAPLTPDQARQRLDRLRSHWLGTDNNGRDVLARLIIGSRVSLSVGFVSVSIYVLIGVVLGSLAGYFKGTVDIGLSRFNEVVTCFPAFFLIISVMSILPPSIWNVMVVIGLTRWTEVYRLVRAEFLRLTALDFVVAGKALGLSPARIVFRHVLPNALGPVLVAAAFGVAGAILIESALSFLGFGVPPPQASWGSVLFDARGHEREMWWVTVFPGLLIFITITAYNLVGEGLRDALDPRLRR